METLVSVVIVVHGTNLLVADSKTVRVGRTEIGYFLIIMDLMVYQTYYFQQDSLNSWSFELSDMVNHENSFASHS